MVDTDRLLRKLRSTSSSTRYDACEELRVASWLPPNAISALLSATKDPSRIVADAASRALALHQDDQSAPAALIAPHSASHSSATVPCPACAHPIAPTSYSCPNCGAVVSNTLVTATIQAAAPAGTPDSSPPSAKGDSSDSPGCASRMLTRLVVLGVVMAIVSVCGWCIATVFIGCDDLRPTKTYQIYCGASQSSLFGCALGSYTTYEEYPWYSRFCR